MFELKDKTGSKNRIISEDKKDFALKSSAELKKEGTLRIFIYLWHGFHTSILWINLNG